ncbi:MAG: hypothetical protein PUC46_05515 [Lachnospiraceae bacterium]|nr:hypothetical protein [Lachnospiraceae bacterium]
MENKAPLEIERKWMVKGWPQQDFPLCKEEYMEQGYVSVTPTVRIRMEEKKGGEGDNSCLSPTSVEAPNVSIRESGNSGISPAGSAESAAPEIRYMLCFKSKGLMTRKEIEFPIAPQYYGQLKDLIGLPLIPKTRRTYLLPDGAHLEVNQVDEGAPTAFWYAEVEFKDEASAKAWDPASCGLADYLNDEVTGLPGQSMGAYWLQTRLAGNTQK